MDTVVFFQAVNLGKGVLESSLTDLGRKKVQKTEIDTDTALSVVVFFIPYIFHFAAAV